MNSWNGFNNLSLAGVEAETGRKTLTPGFHPCKITSAEVKQTKDKAGHGVVVELSALDGSGSVEDFINVNNRNKQAVEIGMRRLKGLLVASGHPNPDKPGDIKSLVGLTVGVHVEEGPSWTDNDGNTRPGGGKPRKSGAYKPIAGEVSNDSPSGGYSPGGEDDLDDDIPF